MSEEINDVEQAEPVELVEAEEPPTGELAEDHDCADDNDEDDDVVRTTKEEEQ